MVSLIRCLVFTERIHWTVKNQKRSTLGLITAHLYGHLRVRNQVICCSHRESYDSPSPNSHMINTLRLAYQCSSYSSAKPAVLQSYGNDFYLTKTDNLLHQKTVLHVGPHTVDLLDHFFVEFKPYKISKQVEFI